MLVISVLLVILFVGITICAERKLPDSISALAYLIPKKGVWIWTLWLWAVTFLILPSLMEAMPEHLTFIGFLCMGSLAFCGAMPLIKNEKNTAHYVFAIIAGILTQVCVTIISPWWLAAWPIYVSMVYLPNYPWNIEKHIAGKGVFLIECVCWLTLTGCLITS